MYIEYGKIKKIYEDVEANAALKETLVAANEEMKGKSEEEIQERIISIAKEFGYELTKEDFVLAEGELDLDDLDGVAGGAVERGCFISDCGCALFGSGYETSCIVVGLGWTD